MQIRQEIFSSQKSKRTQRLIIKRQKTTKIILKLKFIKQQTIKIRTMEKFRKYKFKICKQ